MGRKNYEKRRNMKHHLDSLIKFLHPSKKTVLLILIVVVITVILHTFIAIWLSKFYLPIPSLGTIHTLGVEAYWDANLTDKIDEDEKIDWGTLWLGSSNNATIYLLSLKNDTILSLTKANLIFYDTDETAIQPPTNISTYINLTWNYNGTIASVGDKIPVTLTLSATYSMDFILYLIENNIKSFSLDIIISTTEHTP